MSETPEPADAADALAVALCHLQREQARRRFALPDAVSLRKSRGVRLAIAATGSVTRNPLLRIL
jgi:crossover junction endodeoxyribonuclease RuvC